MVRSSNVVQPNGPAEPDAAPQHRQATDAGPRRARARVARRQAILDAALRIVTDEGLAALTMQRVAAEVDCAVGTIYGYFPGKGALVAAVQTSVIDRLGEAYERFLPEGEAHLGAAPTEVAAVARVLACERFWIEALRTHPQETRLLEMLMVAEGRIMSDDDRMGVLPSALRLLGTAEAAVDAATRAGVLSPGSAFERVVTWAAALNGVLQTSRLIAIDVELFDGIRLARQLSRDLLVGWGADRALLEEADTLLDAFDGSFAPREDAP